MNYIEVMKRALDLVEGEYPHLPECKASEVIDELYTAIAEAESVLVQQSARVMTAERAEYFMLRFKKEEKLLGPNEQAALDFVIDMLATSPVQQAPATDPVRLLKSLGPKPWQTSTEAWAQARLISDFEDAYTTPPAAQPTSLVDGMAKILVERLEEEQAVYLSMQTAKSFVQSMLLAQHSTGEPK